MVEPNSADELARGMRDVVSRLDDFDPMKQHQYVVDHFSQEVVVEQITKRYHIALERHARAADSASSEV